MHVWLETKVLHLCQVNPEYFFLSYRSQILKVKILFWEIRLMNIRNNEALKYVTYFVGPVSRKIKHTWNLTIVKDLI